MRQAAAAAREILIELAARRWGVDRAGLTVKDGAVVETAGSRRIAYGELARESEEALREADKRYASVVFSQAQHSFFNEPMGRYDAPAAAQSWALAMA